MRFTLRPSLPVALGMLALAITAGPSLGQATAPPQKPADKETAQPEAPARGGQRLDKLFEKLKESESLTAARIVANDIERAFERSGSATTDLLFARAVEAMNARDLDLALDLLDYIVTLRPQWAEAFNRRAAIHFARQDFDAALRDIRETLAREPRHYIALEGLGKIMRASGNTKGAYKAFSRAVEIHPYLTELKEALEKMKVDVEGQPI